MQPYKGDSYYTEPVWDYKTDTLQVLSNSVFRLVVRDYDGSLVWVDQFTRRIKLDDLLLRGIPEENAVKIIKEVSERPRNTMRRGEQRIVWGEMEEDIT